MAEITGSTVVSFDPDVLASWPHQLSGSNTNVPAGYPNNITTFNGNSGFVIPNEYGNSATISGGDLILTPDQEYQDGIAVYGTPINVGAGITTEFTYTSTGGSGADGISFFLLDASKISNPSDVTPGSFGGPLGYAQSANGTSTGDGITDGVLGVGLDTFGNFSQSTSPSDTTAPGFEPNSVVIRGAGNELTGYNYLQGAKLAAGIDGTRTVKVTVIPQGANSMVDVQVSTDGGKTFQNVLSTTVAQTVPSQVYYGFTASTGGSDDLHEITSVSTHLIADPEFTSLSVSDATTNTTNPATLAPGDSVSYTYTVANNGPNGTSEIDLQDTAPANLVNETYVVTDDNGSHTGTGSINLNNVTLASGNTATIVVTGQVSPDATSGNLSHQVSATLGSSYVSSDPAGGTTTLDIGGNSPALYLEGADKATTVQGGSVDMPFLSATLNDTNAAADANDTVMASITPSSTTLGALGVANGAPLAVTVNAQTGVLTFQGTESQVSAELQDITFSSKMVTQGQSNTESFVVSAQDQTTGNTATDNRAVVDVASPVLTGNVGGEQTNDSTTSTPFSSLVVSDAVSAPLSATVTEAGNLGDFTPASTMGWTETTEANGSLEYTRTFSGGTDGTPAAEAQAAISGLVFQPTNHENTPGSQAPEAFSVVVADNAGNTSSTLSGNVTVTSTEDGPVVAGVVGGASISDEQTATPFAAASVSDPDNTPITVMASVENAQGDFTAASTSGFTKTTGTDSTGAAVSVYTETFNQGTGSAAAAQAAVQGLVFQPLAHNIDTDSSQTTAFSVVATDGSGASSNATGMDTIKPVDDTPVVQPAMSSISTTDDVAVAPFNGSTPVTVTDPDTTTLTATVNVSPGGTLTAASTVGWTATTNSSGSTTYVKSFGPSNMAATQVQNAVENLVFQPTAHAIALGTTQTTNITLSVADDTGATSATATSSVTVTPKDDGSTLSGGTSQMVSDENTFVPFSGVALADPDNTPLTLTVYEEPMTSAVGTFTAASLAGFTSNAPEMEGNATYNTFTETFNDGNGSAAAAQAALAGLVFQPIANQDAPGTQLQDSFGATLADAEGTMSFLEPLLDDTVTSAHNTPVVAGTPGGASISDAQTSTPYATTMVTDPDDIGLSATVTLSNPALGDFTPASAAGFTRTVQPDGSVNYTQTFAAKPDVGAQAQAAVDALVFQPTDHVNAPGTMTTENYSVVVADSELAKSGTVSGADTVTAALDPATVSGTPATLSTTAGTAVQPFATTTVSEPDTLPATLVVTVENGVLQGDLTAASTNGFTRTVSGQNIIYTENLPSGANEGAAVTSLVTGLSFVPNAGTPGTTQDTTIDLAATFGTQASVMTSIVIASSTPGLPLFPYPTLYAQDSDPTAQMTVTATLPPGTQGSYATLGMGTVDPDNSLTYTVTGTAAQVTAALHAVTFVPSSGDTLPGTYSASINGMGNQATLFDAGTGNNTLATTGTSDGVISGAGTDTVFSSATGTSQLIGNGPDTFVSGGNQTTVFSGAGGSVFFGGTGSSTMAQSTGNDTFVGGSGDASIYGGSGTSLEFGGMGNYSFEGSSGMATIVASSGANTVFGGTGAVSVYGTAAGTGVYVGGSTGNNVILSSTGDSTLVGAGATDNLVAQGNSPDLLVAGSGQDTLTGTASSGNDTYVGAAGNALIAAGSGNSLVVGGSGSDTVYAGTGGGNLTYFGGSGTDSVIGSAYQDTFAVGSGNETLIGSGGTDTYVLNNGHAGGTITVQDFKVGIDQVALFGYASTQVASAEAAETVSGGSTSLSFSDGTRMTFVGITNINGSIVHGADAFPGQSA